MELSGMCQETVRDNGGYLVGSSEVRAMKFCY